MNADKIKRMLDACYLAKRIRELLPELPRLRNLQNTLERLLQLHTIPIINENDPIACEEYSLGDNDTLAALVATCIHADLVVLMSDIDGLYTANPHTHPDAKLIPLVERITPEVLALADGAGSA